MIQPECRGHATAVLLCGLAHLGILAKLTEIRFGAKAIQSAQDFCFIDA